MEASLSCNFDTSVINTGTHDIQNIIVSSSTPGEIRVIGDFINGSTARTLLAVIYTNSGSDVYYMFSPMFSEEEKIIATISGIPSGMYNVSVFVVEDNRLPFNRSATTPRNVSVTDGGGGRGKLLNIAS